MAAVLKKRALAEYCHTVTVTEDVQRPAKRLQIVRRSKTSDQWDFNLSQIDVKQNPKDLLDSLLGLQQALPSPRELSHDLFKRITELLSNINGGLLTTVGNKNKLCSIITSKVLSLLSVLVTSTSESQSALEEVLSCTIKSKSKRVISHGIQAAFAIITKSNPGPKYVEQVLQVALTSIDTNNHMVKIRCLEALGGLCPTEVENEKSQSDIIRALILHSKEQDNRVRTATFKALLEIRGKGILVPNSLYENVCAALQDDYECVRESALFLIKSLAEQNPESMVPVPSSEHRIRLIDNAFSQICNAVNDVSIRVRTKAITLLGTMCGVSDNFLHQTLDKKLMSNMRRKCSAHERARVMASSGEFTSGKRWSEDAPQETIRADQATVIDSGACGAFVHGLEDEFLEVRTAALESICSLAIGNTHFANQCLDFLVDMFNDEIEDVRLIAIQVLQKIAPHIKLRPDQLDEILHALKDSWLDIRESLHTMLATCKLCTTTCMTATVGGLLDNVRRYPQDKRSIQRCLKQLGTNHPELVLALVPQLLVIHPYFDGVEPSVQDGDYICKLILVLNAATLSPTILPLLEQHTFRHYTYLRDTMPHLVPQLKFDKDLSKISQNDVKNTTLMFLKESLEKTNLPTTASSCLRLTIYATLDSDLLKLASIEPSLTAASKLASIYINCMLVFTKVFSSRDWITPSSLSSQQRGALKTSVEQLLRNTLRLRYSFSHLSPGEEASIRSLRVRTLALQLVYVVRGSTGSALGLCDNFLEHTETLDKYLNQQRLQSDSFIKTVVKELSELEEAPRPGAVARILEPLLLSHPVPALNPFVNPEKISMCWAEILDPSPDNETLYKLSAGLIVGIPLSAEIWNLEEREECLRIRISHPDHSSYLVVPNSSHLRKVSDGCYRLLTTVLVSAQVWSEACQVGISLVLDLSEQEASKGRKHSYIKTADDSATMVSLCSQAKVLVWPKHVRRGV